MEAAVGALLIGFVLGGAVFTWQHRRVVALYERFILRR